MQIRPVLPCQFNELKEQFNKSSYQTYGKMPNLLLKVEI